MLATVFGAFSRRRLVGGALLVLSCFFFFAGFALFLVDDGVLLFLGDLFFLSALVLLLGGERLVALGRRAGVRGCVTFTGGVILVLSRSPLFGLILQLLGALELLGPVLPSFVDALRLLPGSSAILDSERARAAAAAMGAARSRADSVPTSALLVVVAACGASKIFTGDDKSFSHPPAIRNDMHSDSVISSEDHQPADVGLGTGLIAALIICTGTVGAGYTWVRRMQMEGDESGRRTGVGSADAGKGESGGEGEGDGDRASVGKAESDCKGEDATHGVQRRSEGNGKGKDSSDDGNDENDDDNAAAEPGSASGVLAGGIGPLSLMKSLAATAGSVVSSVTAASASGDGTSSGAAADGADEHIDSFTVDEIDDGDSGDEPDLDDAASPWEVAEEFANDCNNTDALLQFRRRSAQASTDAVPTSDDMELWLELDATSLSIPEPVSWSALTEGGVQSDMSALFSQSKAVKNCKSEDLSHSAATEAGGQGTTEMDMDTALAFSKALRCGRHRTSGSDRLSETDVAPHSFAAGKTHCASDAAELLPCHVLLGYLAARARAARGLALVAEATLVQSCVVAAEAGARAADKMVAAAGHVDEETSAPSCKSSDEFAGTGTGEHAILSVLRTLDIEAIGIASRSKTAKKPKSKARTKKKSKMPQANEKLKGSTSQPAIAASAARAQLARVEQALAALDEELVAGDNVQKGHAGAACEHTMAQDAWRRSSIMLWADSNAACAIPDRQNMAADNAAIQIGSAHGVEALRTALLAHCDGAAEGGLTIPLTWLQARRQQIDQVEAKRDQSTYPVAADPVKLVNLHVGTTFGATGGLSPQQLHQDSRDIGRDNIFLTVRDERLGEAAHSNVLLHGAELDYEGVVRAIAAVMHRLLRGAGFGEGTTVDELISDNESKQSVDTGSVDNALLHGFARRILNTCNRTCSGGAAIDTLGALGVDRYRADDKKSTGTTWGGEPRQDMLLVPDSAAAPPLHVVLDVGPFCAPSRLQLAGEKGIENDIGDRSMGAGVKWNWGLRAGLEATTVFNLMHDDPVDELSGRWARLHASFRTTLAFALDCGAKTCVGASLKSMSLQDVLVREGAGEVVISCCALEAADDQ